MGLINLIKLKSLKSKNAINVEKTASAALELKISEHLEKMDDFFTRRADGYDEHMLYHVSGCREGYKRMSELIPVYTLELLDLGCGTGLELEAIFNKIPAVHVTGIDLTEAMLHKLQEKYPDKELTLIHGSYFDCNFGKEKFDTAISFQTLHHFSHSDKIQLYKKIHSALNFDGKYLECDYMVTTQEEEDFYYQELARIRKNQKIREVGFYHYDTPCTIQNQINMLKEAGFSKVYMDWRLENTTIVVAEK